MLAQALHEHLDYFEALGVSHMAAAAAPPLSTNSAQLRGVMGANNSRAMPHQSSQIISARKPLEGARFNGHNKPHPSPISQGSSSADQASEGKCLSSTNHDLPQCQDCELSQGQMPPPLQVLGRGGCNPQVVVVGPDPSMYAPEIIDLATKMMTKVLDLKGEEYYFTTVLKCPPAEEDGPTLEAVMACRPALIKELGALKPIIVLAMGELAAQALSGLKLPLGLLRPMTHEVKEFPGMWLRVTYGLEHLVGSVELKKEALADLLKIKQALNKLVVNTSQK